MIFFFNLLALAWMDSSVYYMRQHLATKRGTIAVPLISFLLLLLFTGYMLIVDWMIYSGIQC